MDFHNRLASEAANYGGSNYGGTPQVASASIGLGPNGGFQAGQISPVSLTFLIEDESFIGKYLEIARLVTV